MRKGSPKKVFKVSLVVGTLFFSASLANQTQAAVTTTVIPGESIQACIDASANGDTCLVSAGTYTENLSIAKGVILQSADGAASTIINGDCAGPVISIVGESANYTPIVDGFTIENGCAPQGAGGGISLFNGDGEIRNSIIRANSAAAGGGVAVHKANVTITGCEITNNTATGTVDTAAISECLITSYSVPIQGGGGIFADCISFLTLIDTDITGNTSGGDAGGIFSDESFLVSRYNKITGNSGTDKGGGIFYAGSGSVFSSINDLIACNNANMAGGIYNQSGSQPTELINSTVAGNTAVAVGGVFSEGGSPISFVNTIVHQNFPNTPVYDLAVTCSAFSDIDTGIEGTVIPGEWNINANPLFADPAGCDFHLLEASPCFDTGTPFPVSCFNNPMPTQDLDGEIRPQGVSHDIGAYEVTVCIDNTDQESCDALPECEWVWRGTLGLCADYVPPEICDNNIDDNNNGLTDCEDVACWDVCPNSCDEITDQTTCDSSPLVCIWDGAGCIIRPDDLCNIHNGDSTACKTADGCSYNKKTNICYTK